MDASVNIIGNIDGHWNSTKSPEHFEPDSVVTFANGSDIDCLVMFADPATFGIKAVGLAANRSFSLRMHGSEPEPIARVGNLVVQYSGTDPIPYP